MRRGEGRLKGWEGRRERKERGNGKGGEWAGGKEGKMGDVREGQGEVGGNLGE